MALCHAALERDPRVAVTPPRRSRSEPVGQSPSHWGKIHAPLRGHSQPARAPGACRPGTGPVACLPVTGPPVACRPKPRASRGGPRPSATPFAARRPRRPPLRRARAATCAAAHAACRLTTRVQAGPGRMLGTAAGRSVPPRVLAVVREARVRVPAGRPETRCCPWRVVPQRASIAKLHAVESESGREKEGETE